MGRPRKYPPPERDPNWEPPEDLKARVHYLAWRWSMGRPEVVDDLYQEGLLAIWLKGETAAPLNHQLRTAQNRMLSVRKLGRSVDGKLNPNYRRSRQWLIGSLDEASHAAAGQQPVERYVINRLTLQGLLAQLQPQERLCLALVYQGYQQAEVAELMGRSRHSVEKMMRRIRRKLLTEGGPLVLCHSCEALVINGVLCHERGCPDPPEAEKDDTRTCRWCGSEFKPESRDQEFCDDECAQAYAS